MLIRLYGFLKVKIKVKNSLSKIVMFILGIRVEGLC